MNGRTAKERFEALETDQERLWEIFDSVERLKVTLKRNYVTRQQLLIWGLSMAVLFLGASKLPTILCVAKMLLV